MPRARSTKCTPALRGAEQGRTLPRMIQLSEVVKEYGGPLSRARGHAVRALDGVSFTVRPGTALGIVGPNGAGKSTLIRLLLGYLRVSRGTIRIEGLAPRAYAERHGVGYVPEQVAVRPDFTVRRALRTFAALGELEQAEERVDAVLERTGLAPMGERKVAALSKGMLQRIAIAQALLGPRRLMVLDEPTTGLDPEWIYELRGMVAEWRAADPARVVLIASHDLDELERTVDRVLVLESGRVREEIDLLAEQAGFPPYRLEVEPVHGAEQAVRAAFPDAVPEEGPGLAFHVHPVDAADLSRRTAALLQAGVVVRSLAAQQATLEDRFRRTVRPARGTQEGR